MWVIIILIIAAILFFFIRDWYKQNKKMAKEGGMITKYKLLIDFLKEGDPRTKIYRATNDEVVVGLEVMGGYSKFTLYQTFETITIQWISESNIYGKHKLNWEFAQNLDQQKMIQLIADKMNELNKNIM